MTHNKVHSLGNVPFSWENSPGICRKTQKCKDQDDRNKEVFILPPPPCSHESPRAWRKDLQIPLPPVPFQSALRSASKKGLEREDPFLAAYIQCTKGSTYGKLGKDNKKSGGLRVVRRMFSCKYSCGIREDGFVRLSQVNRPPKNED